MREFPLAPRALIFSGRLMVARLTILHQVLDDAGDLMRGGHRGLLRSEPGPHHADVSTEGSA